MTGVNVRGDRSIQIAATPDVVYAVVSDLTRMGDFSPECLGVEWLDGATGPRPGARFVGHNRRGPRSWSLEGRVLTAERGKAFSFATEWRGHDSTSWTYGLEAADGGTKLTESYELLWAPWWMRAVEVLTFRHRQLDQGMARTLIRIKNQLEALSVDSEDDPVTSPDTNPISESTDQFTEMAWIKFLGVEPLAAEEGRAVIRLDPQPVHLNHNGTVNAAILYALAEVAGAGAVVAGMLELAARSYTVVKRASIEYLAPARGAVTATGEIALESFVAARSSVESGEGAEVEVPVEVSDAEGSLAARCVLVVAVRPRRPS